MPDRLLFFPTVDFVAFVITKLDGDYLICIGVGAAISVDMSCFFVVFFSAISGVSMNQIKKMQGYVISVLKVVSRV